MPGRGRIPPKYFSALKEDPKTSDKLAMASRISISQFIFFLAAGALSGCTVSNPVAWWQSVNHKAEHLAQVEANFHVLEHEHAALKKQFFALEHEYADLKAKSMSEEKVSVSLAETGSALGRTPASISYQVPKGLKPEEMKALAFEHFREKRFAESAATFEEFLVSPESASLHDADSMYTAGVAWFQLGNFTKATEHLNDAKAASSGAQKEKIRKKVDLWLRVIDRKRADEAAHHGG
ncbi:MAG: hypothetical protein EOP11_05840 [Proteobacteria bacterium]|nr:MAG: hypothetical protein EOP11_05840 [Pseudomonadota bacterium]